MSIASVVRRAAGDFGSRVAVEDSAGSVTFADLSERVHRLACGLERIGVPPGGTVLVLLPNSSAAVEVDLALTIGGYVRVALNPRVGRLDWARIGRDCAPDALIFDPSIEGGQEFAGQSAAGMVIAARAADHAHHTLAEVMDSAPVGVLPRDPDPGSLCALHYSSGTTGVPKGAQRTHANRLASMRAMRDHVLAGTLDGPGPSVFIHAGPVIHTSGLFVLPLLAAGGRQVLLDHARPADVIAAFGRHGGTHTALVPTVIARLLDFDDAALAPLRRARMLAYAGAPMPVAHLREAYRRITPNLVQYYGMVEAIPPLTVLNVADHRRGMGSEPELLSSIGRPCGGSRIDFRGAAGPLPAGETGELVVSGPAVSPGYHNAGVRTDLGKSHADGVLHSGDLGYRGPNGYLHLTGRSKDMIITGGYNVYPREVEEEISAIDGVDDVVAVGLPDPLWGQRIVVAFTTLADATADAETVLEESRIRLPDYKRPKAVRHVGALPLTPLGKVDRLAATQLLEALAQKSTD